ncbi:uncharacterized protein LOC123004012 [Tribolium madens]|uniref:uncharacterized protein LOC123004012 n=1 Tax=Tribolium madens TaxID=41895 RepID=UPI001CF75699|nr:uncharacterized protein LOC123004012 [Tribolium madens]
MCRFLTSFAILVLLFQPTKPFVLTTIEITAEFLELLRNLYETFNTVNDKADLIDLPYKTKEEKLFEILDNVNLRIKQLDDRLYGFEQNLNTINKMLINLPQVIRLELNLNDIRNKQSFIMNYYDKMEKYVRDFDEYESSTITNICDNVISNNPNSVRFLMEAIYEHVIRDDFLKQFQKQFEPKGNLFCTEGQSSQDVLHKFLIEILLINFKTFYLERTAYTIKKLYRQGNFTKESHLAQNEYFRRQNSLINKISKHMRSSSREIWRCDPDQHVEGETYVQIRNFLHGFILNKVNLDPQGKCRDECDVYKMTKTQKCRDNNWCKKEPSCSKIVNCQYLDSSMRVCSNSMNKHNRRYQYVELGNGQVLGEKQVCQGYKTDLSTYIDWVIWRCSYCFCLCDEGPKYYSDRYINLRLSMANLTDNRVVTGLRFVKHNKIIHLQIQEGKLLEGGKIAPDSVHWVPPEDYKTTDRYIHEGQDYHIITWEQRSIELSELMAQKGSVITGVRFRRVGARLDLEALTTPFNFTTGKLHPNPEIWSIFEGTPNLKLRHKFGQEVKLSSPDIPTRTTEPHNLIATGKYIDFTNTDLYKDAAQTTVPFFDAQQVYSKNPVPLSGVGLLHRGRKGSGGFIAPKIFTYDFSQHLLIKNKPNGRLRN